MGVPKKLTWAPSSFVVGDTDISQAGFLHSELWVLKGISGGGNTPYNGLYREAPPERGTLFRLEVYKRVGISRAEV